MAYGGIIGQSFDDSAIKEYIDQQINELKQQISETSIKIATGSYVGTGTFGESNPTVILSDFQAKAIIILCSENNDGIIAIEGSTKSGFVLRASSNGVTFTSSGGVIAFNEKSISIYANTALLQCNKSGASYSYLIWG